MFCKLEQRHLGALYLATASSIWGGMYVVSKVVLEVIPPLELVWIRYAVAMVALVVVGLITRQSWRIRWLDVPLVAAIGIVGYDVSIWAQFLGTTLSSAQMGSVITSATPAFMVIFARLLLGERLTWRKGISVVFATLGVLLIVGVGTLNEKYQLGGFVLGIAAVTWALMSVLVKRVSGDYSQIAVTTYAMLLATAVLTPFTVTHMYQVTVVLARPTIGGGVLFLGIVCTAGAFFLWNKGLQMVDVASGGLYFFFQPLVGTLLGWLVLGERVGITFWIGAVFILGGVMLATKK